MPKSRPRTNLRLLPAVLYSLRRRNCKEKHFMERMKVEMTKTVKKLFSLLLCFSLVLGMFVMPVSATGAEEAATVTGDTAQAAPAEKTATAPEETTEDANSGSAAPALSFAGVEFSPETLLNLADTEVDEEDATILAVKEELKGIQVLNADGETVPLTEDEIQAVLAYFQQYLGILADNANIYGIQTPFFLSFNDSGEDGLGILGEMLVLAGYSVQDVRDGKYAFMDLVMMIKTFIYTYGLGAEYYGSAILAGQKEALQAVKDSGAKTEAQKLLVLNNWIAQNNTFDMPYIMNADSDHSGTVEKDEVIMAAPDGSSILTTQDQNGNPVEYYGANGKNANYSKVQSYVEKDLEKFFTEMFHDQIYAGVLAELELTYYKEAISATLKDMYTAGAVSEAAKDPDVVADAKAAYKQEVYEEKLEELKKSDVYQDAYDAEFNKYLDDNCEHDFETDAKFTWKDDGNGNYSATADLTCSKCGREHKNVEAEITAKTLEATCTEGKREVRIATVKVGDYEVSDTKVISNDNTPNPDAHTEVTDAAVEATCTEAGKTEGKHCSACDKVLVAQEEIPALGHKDENANGKCDRCETELSSGEASTPETLNEGEENSPSVRKQMLLLRLQQKKLSRPRLKSRQTKLLLL